uniref:Uncharacterized protein n=1 Tax=Panagrolaimus sp. JU765 TaxID=591449 RepID=A0AC34QY65_9BILA
MLDDAVFLSKEPLSGPNFEYEARLIRFYIVVNKQYIVPMIGRISHISADDSRQTIYPDAAKIPAPEQLKKFGLTKEEPYFHKTPEVDENFAVFDLMSSRARKS